MTRQELDAAGFDVSEVAYARLARFVQLLRAENEKLNLTAACDEDEIWRVHVCDSLTLLPVVRSHAVRRLLDLGTGGGLPGLPLACVTGRVDVTLVDATRKKIVAVRHIIARLGLDNARGVWGRSELLAHLPVYREQFDAVTARAVASLPVLLEYAAGFVRPGGRCWFFKSAAAASPEGAMAESAARACKLEYVDALPYRLRGERDDRVLMHFRKIAKLSPDLPRRPGKPSKHPL